VTLRNTLIVCAVLLMLAALRVPKQQREVTTAATREPEGARLGPPGYFAAPVLGTAAILGVAGALSDLPLVAFFGAALCFGIWQLALAARLRRWERISGRTLLVRPVYRFYPTGDRRFGRGWMDPANFVVR
jgi:hypothetical protein